MSKLNSRPRYPVASTRPFKRTVLNSGPNANRDEPTLALIAIRSTRRVRAAVIPPRSGREACDVLGGDRIDHTNCLTLDVERVARGSHGYRSPQSHRAADSVWEARTPPGRLPNSAGQVVPVSNDNKKNFCGHDYPSPY